MKSLITKRLPISFALLSIMLLLTACGWHLRGLLDLSPQLKQVYIKTRTPNSPLVFELKQLLRANHATVVSDPNLAKSIVILSPLRIQNRLTSQTGGGEAGQYTLTMSITFSVRSSNGKVLLPDTLIQASRQYNSNASQVLSNNSKINTLSRQMRSQIANSIVNQLAKIPDSK